MIQPGQADLGIRTGTVLCWARVQELLSSKSWNMQEPEVRIFTVSLLGMA